MSEDYETKPYKPLVENPSCYPSHRWFIHYGLWSRQDGRRKFLGFKNETIEVRSKVNCCVPLYSSNFRNSPNLTLCRITREGNNRQDMNVCFAVIIESKLLRTLANVPCIGMEVKSSVEGTFHLSFPGVKKEKGSHFEFSLRMVAWNPLACEKESVSRGFRAEIPTFWSP